jgi:hypothetical protein
MFMSEIVAGLDELIIHKNTSNTATTNDFVLNNSEKLQKTMSRSCLWIDVTNWLGNVR